MENAQKGLMEVSEPRELGLRVGNVMGLSGQRVLNVAQGPI